MIDTKSPALVSDSSDETVVNEVESSFQNQTEDVEINDNESPLILEEMVIEEVNIDGMCGVY